MMCAHFVNFIRTCTFRALDVYAHTLCARYSRVHMVLMVGRAYSFTFPGIPILAKLPKHFRGKPEKSLVWVPRELKMAGSPTFSKSEMEGFSEMVFTEMEIL